MNFDNPQANKWDGKPLHLFWDASISIIFYLSSMFCSPTNLKINNDTNRIDDTDDHKMRDR